MNGFPVEELLRASEEADLLVLGSRGIGGFARMLLGSTAAQVVRHASCRCSIVPPPVHG